MRYVPRALAAALVGVIVALAVACDDQDPSPPPRAASATATVIPLTPRPETPGPTTTPTPQPSRTPAIESPTASPTVTPPPTTGAMPDRDPLELAVRLGHVATPVPTAVTVDVDRVVGTTESFFLLDVTGPSVITIRATLRKVSEHAYFYFQDGVDVSEDDLEAAATGFEETVYPLITRDFGADSQAGIDGDPRIALLHADAPGVGGYFSDQDSLPLVVSPYSNQRKIIVLNSSGLDLASRGYLGLVAHELQHLVHNNLDPSEESWVNEGLSEVANSQVNDSPGLIPSFLSSPDLQLTDWGVVGESAAHYGASHLFFRYLLRRTGGVGQARIVASEPGDGIDGVARYLSEVGADDTFEALFTDWVVANYLNEPGDGRYSQPGVADVAHAELETDEPAAGRGTVSQFAADYLVYGGDTPKLTVTFDGAESVGVVSAQPPDGGGFWWSGRGDSIDSRLTREVDLGGVSTATLHFRTWFDIEKSWDFGYVEVSADGGSTWEILRTTDSDDEDPLQLAYGPGYTGDSGGAWIDQEADLTPYAGRLILLRFEYVTDEASNLGGWAIDDIEVPEVGFPDTGDAPAGWQDEGFRIVEGPLPQRFVVQLIVERDGGPEIRSLTLGGDNAVTATIEGLGDDVRRVVLVVAAMTDGTNLPAGYRYAFDAE